MKSVIILQARSTSTRLPGKIFLPLLDSPMLFHIINRLSKVKHADSLCVATINRDFERIRGIAAPFNTIVVVGPEDDVLERYRLAAEKTQADVVVRCTADNPLVFFEGIDKALEVFHPTDCDYLVMDGLPYGSGFEVFSRKVLEEAADQGKTLREREHVTPYIYDRPKQFRIRKIPAPTDMVAPDLRVTVDTQEDYDRMLGFYMRYYDSSIGTVPLKQVVANEHP